MNCSQSAHQTASSPICRMVMIRGRSFQSDGENNSKSNRSAPLRPEISAKTLKRSLRVLHYPSSPKTGGAEIDTFAGASTLLDSPGPWAFIWMAIHAQRQPF